MALEKVRGIIIKTLDFKEKDKLVFIFTKEKGKISSIIKNVRTKTSKNASVVQPLNICDFVVFRGKSMYSLNEISLVNSLSDIKSDYDLLTYSLYYLELADISLQDEEENEPYFFDLIKALYFLPIEGINIKLLTRAFEIKTLIRSGNYPDVSLIEGYLSNEAKGILRFLLNTDLEKINVIKPSEKAIKEIGEVTKELIKTSYHRIPKSLEMLEML